MLKNHLLLGNRKEWPGNQLKANATQSFLNPYLHSKLWQLLNHVKVPFSW
jgi:hypothetical protein